MCRPAWRDTCEKLSKRFLDLRERLGDLRERLGELQIKRLEWLIKCSESSKEEEAKGNGAPPEMNENGPVCTSPCQASQRQDKGLSGQDSYEGNQVIQPGKSPTAKDELDELSKGLPSIEANEGDGSSSLAAGSTPNVDACGPDAMIEETPVLSESMKNDRQAPTCGDVDDKEPLCDGPTSDEGEDRLPLKEQISALQKQLQEIKDIVCKVFTPDPPTCSTPPPTCSCQNRNQQVLQYILRKCCGTLFVS